MRVAVIGATGMVGQVMLRVLEERNFPMDELLLAASERSVGKEIMFKGKKHKMISVADAVAAKPDVALFSAGGGTSREWAPKFAEVGTTVIDNSSAWRMNDNYHLVVPEINGHLLTDQDKIIANPNCSTMQMVVALAPLQENYGIERLVISTYQSVTGTGVKAVQQMEDERAGLEGDKVYPHPIDKNCLPHGGDFDESGYTTEEVKLVNETRKIFGDNSIKVTATVVRVPVVGGHSISVNVELKKDFDLDVVRQQLAEMPGVIIQDDPQNNHYPMPLTAHNKDEVFVGRIRRDDSHPRALNMWIVSDNLRKGAATNAIQIAEYLQQSVLA